MQEEMFCFTMGQCELHQLIPRDGKHVKECEFLRSSTHVTSMNIVDDQTGTTHSMPVVVISNDDYDEDQEQLAEEKIPITEDLIFMKYETEDIVEGEDDLQVETRVGYVFYYPEMQICKVLECALEESAS